MQTQKRAIITGASSGIGLELARELALRGWALALLARRTELLDDAVRAIGANAVAIPCDVTDSGAVHDAVKHGESRLGGAFDLAVANAGVGIPSHAAKFNLAEAEQTIRVNVLGMMYLFDAVIPGMIERRSGRFVGVASVAGLRGLPTAAPYSASKAAMQAFLEASRIELVPYGVGVTIVNPGFIVTAMTEKNRFKMPFLMKADKAARVIADGIEGGRRVVEFPRRMSLVMRTVRLLPDSLYERMTGPYSRRKAGPSKVKP
ncbi:MAG: SDR family NAD(P)-dependent oxidoreductase [Thermoanaerobaculia bacterium]|nr:SDR family NAD(P)-dependent oxidoreductase [Thermoanaerobaculia bacterium]